MAPAGEEKAAWWKSGSYDNTEGKTPQHTKQIRVIKLLSL